MKNASYRGEIIIVFWGKIKFQKLHPPENVLDPRMLPYAVYYLHLLLQLKQMNFIKNPYI